MVVMAAGDFAAFYAGAYPGAKRLAHLLLDGSPAADDLVHDVFSELGPVYGDVVDPEDHLRFALVDRCTGRRAAGRRPAFRPRLEAGPVEIRDPSSTPSRPYRSVNEPPSSCATGPRSPTSTSPPRSAPARRRYGC